MASNLPPGVTESMIPGNRPEDEWAEKFWDAVEIPPELFLAVDPHQLAGNVTAFLTCVSSYYSEGFKEGKCES